jgi:hypothetical protein
MVHGYRKPCKRASLLARKLIWASCKVILQGAMNVNIATGHRAYTSKKSMQFCHFVNQNITYSESKWYKPPPEKGLTRKLIWVILHEARNM